MLLTLRMPVLPAAMISSSEESEVQRTMGDVAATSPMTMTRCTRDHAMGDHPTGRCQKQASSHCQNAMPKHWR